MKKLLFAAAIAAMVFGNEAYASSDNSTNKNLTSTSKNSSKPGGTDTKIVVTTFYGSTARNSDKNPCKGATIRVCGTIESRIEMIDPQTAKVTTIVKDADGNTINVESDTKQASAEEAVMDIANKAIEEGGNVIKID